MEKEKYYLKTGHIFRKSEQFLLQIVVGSQSDDHNLNCHSHTTFATENAPPNNLYGKEAETTTRMKKPIYQCLGQLPIMSTIACFHFGMNGKRVFDDSYVTWCQTLKNLFWGAQA